MFGSLAQYLLEKCEITPGELELIKNVAAPKKIRKNHYLLEEGNVSDFIGFVVKGGFRLFRIGEEGVEHIMRFAIENWWMTDFSSFMSGQPSHCYIEALEDSEMLLFS